jgi:hypothetical protein
MNHDRHHIFNPGSTFDYATGRWMVSSLETEWSCPVHDMDVNGECDDCGSPPEIECLDCLTGDYRVKYDADGWATMNLSWRYLVPDGVGGWSVASA